MNVTFGQRANMKTAYVPFDLMGRTTTVSNCLFSNFSFAKPDFQILSLFLAFLQLVCELINCNKHQFI